MARTTYEKLVRATGWYDAILMVPFLFPGVVAWTLSVIQRVDASLGLPGGVGDFPPLALFFVNMMAVITAVWAVARARNPLLEYGFWDGVTRLLLSLLMVAYVVFLDATAVLLLFAVVEAGLGAVQVWGYARASDAGRQ